MFWISLYLILGAFLGFLELAVLKNDGKEFDPIVRFFTVVLASIVWLPRTIWMIAVWITEWIVRESIKNTEEQDNAP